MKQKAECHWSHPEWGLHIWFPVTLILVQRLEVAAAIMWEAAGTRVWIRSHFQSHFPSHCTMVPARTKRSTKASVKSSNFTDHDMNGCICLWNLVPKCRCSHVFFKGVTMIKRSMPALSMNLHDYLGTWHIFYVKKAHRVKAYGESFSMSRQLSGPTCVRITLYANWANIFYIWTTVIIQLKGARKILHYRTETQAWDTHLLCHWFCQILVFCMLM